MHNITFLKQLLKFKTDAEDFYTRGFLSTFSKVGVTEGMVNIFSAPLNFFLTNTGKTNVSNAILQIITSHNMRSLLYKSQKFADFRIFSKVSENFQRL